MGAAQRGRNQVDVTLVQRLSAFGQPLHGPIDCVSFTLYLPNNRVSRNGLKGLHFSRQIISEPILIKPFGDSLIVTGRLVGKHNF